MKKTNHKQNQKQITSDFIIIAIFKCYMQTDTFDVDY